MGTTAFLGSLIRKKVFCAAYKEKNMNPTKLILLVLLTSVLILLAACAPEATTAPEGEQENLVQPDAEGDSYPAPDDNEAVQSGDSDEPYPRPQVNNPYPEPQVYNPYPSIEVVGNASNLDLSGAIMPAEFAVVSSDQDFHVAAVFVDHSEIILKESGPVQAELVIVGNLPSPCHQLRVIAPEPDSTGHIMVQVYSVTDPEKTCAQVLEPFTAVVPLGTVSEGAFTISINNEMTGEFVLP
jgi:hypothetical protein